VLVLPDGFYNGVVGTYWDRIDTAGQRLTGTYSDRVVVPANGVLPTAGNTAVTSLARQVTVYMHEVVNLFLRKEGKTFVFLDWDKRIRRARWKETKEPPDPASVLRQYFDGLHGCPAYRAKWLDGLGGGIPPVSRASTASAPYPDCPTFDEFVTTYNLTLTGVPLHRPGEEELGPTIGQHEVIHYDCMYDIVSGKSRPIPEVLAARDKVSGTSMEPDPSWYEPGGSLEEDISLWRSLFLGWLVSRIGHAEKPNADPGESVARFARSLLGCFHRVPGDDSFVYIYGPGGTGKSLLQNSFSAMCGEYSTEVTRQALTKGSQTGHSSNVIQIYTGARIAIVKEAKNDRGDIDTELIKDITSYEPGRMYAIRAAYDTQPRMYATAAKPLFISNDPPYHLLESDGIDRRLVSFPFLSRYVQTGEADRGLPEKLVTPRMRCALLRFLLGYRDGFLARGATPEYGENNAEGAVSTYDIYMDLFRYKAFLTNTAYYGDSVNSRDLLEIRAHVQGFTSVEEMLLELGLSKNRATREAVHAVRDLIDSPTKSSVALGKASGGKRVLLNAALTDEGKRVLAEARNALGCD